MSFPMEVLTYGLRRRLHELATCNELLTLQVAAPDYHGLQPMQQFRSVDTVTITVTDNKVVVKATNGATEVNATDGYINLRDDLQIHDFTLEESVDLGNFRLAPNYINLHGCLISEELVSSFVAQNLQTVKQLTIGGTCGIQSDKVVKMLCSAPLLTPLEKLVITDGSDASLNCWLEAVIETSHPSMRTMHWEDATLCTLQINKYRFERLIRLQQDNFKLEIYFKNSARIVKVEKQLTEFFDHAFDWAWKDYSQKSVKVSYGPRGREFTKYYYLRDEFTY
uniref:FBA_2 domain-containing protein n=1 Tax=Panagrellus redivivus TaxID=6233 RepID=A0A7E4UL91_PANRE